MSVTVWYSLVKSPEERRPFSPFAEDLQAVIDSIQSKIYLWFWSFNTPSHYGLKPFLIGWLYSGLMPL